MNDDFQNRVKKLRESKGFSQELMAKKLNVSRTAYINFESGINKQYSKALAPFCEFFDISEVELLYGKDVLEEEINYKEQFFALKKEFCDILEQKDKEISKYKKELKESQEIISILTTSYQSLLEEK